MVFRTMPNIYDRAFYESSSQKTVNCFLQKTPSQIFDMVQILSLAAEKKWSAFYWKWKSTWGFPKKHVRNI